MKQIVILIAILFTCACDSHAQVNYVRNASFETHWRCPTTLNQVTFADYWSAIDTINIRPDMGDTFSVPNCSPEYISVCARGNYIVGAPENSRFYQYPRTGDGMMQIIAFFDESYSSPSIRDYLQGRLKNSLIAGHTYCVTLYVNFEGNTSSIPCQNSIDHIGAYLDNGTISKDTGIDKCGQYHPEITPQIYSPTIIDDTVNWTKIQGSFVANGTEKFITIGNFFDKAHTNYLTYSNTSAFSWYLVDDISVIESTEVAHAGPDVAVVVGDSVHIGTNEEGMPCTWYVSGGSTPIGYSGGIWVKPNMTTTYVVEMDLCGNVTRDSVKVNVWPVGMKPVSLKEELAIWPNPVFNELHIDNGGECEVQVYDVVGKEIYKQRLSSDKETINVSALPKGIYLVHIIDPVTGLRITKRIIRE